MYYSQIAGRIALRFYKFRQNPLLNTCAHLSAADRRFLLSTESGREATDAIEELTKLFLPNPNSARDYVFSLSYYNVAVDKRWADAPLFFLFYNPLSETATLHAFGYGQEALKENREVTYTERGEPEFLYDPTLLGIRNLYIVDVTTGKPPILFKDFPCGYPGNPNTATVFSEMYGEWEKEPTNKAGRVSTLSATFLRCRNMPRKLDMQSELAQLNTRIAKDIVKQLFVSGVENVDNGLLQWLHDAEVGRRIDTSAVSVTPWTLRKATDGWVFGKL